MKFLVSAVLLGLVASHATARVLQILPTEGCGASVMPVKGGNEAIAILPVEGGVGGASILPIEVGNEEISILPVINPGDNNKLPGSSFEILPVEGSKPRPVPSNKLPPAQDQSSIGILPVDGGHQEVSILPVNPISILPVEGSSGGANILPVEQELPEYIWPVRPVAPIGFVPPPVVNPGDNNKLPGNSFDILPVNPISILPVEGSNGGISILPVEESSGGANILPVVNPGEHNKLPGTSFEILPVNPISILPVEGSNQEAVILPVQPQPEYEMHIPDHSIIF